MNLTYSVNCVTDGDGGESVDSFTDKDEAIQCYHESVAEFPESEFDITVHDEDGDVIGLFTPGGDYVEVE